MINTNQGTRGGRKVYETCNKSYLCPKSQVKGVVCKFKLIARRLSPQVTEDESVGRLFFLACRRAVTQRATEEVTAGETGGKLP